MLFWTYNLILLASLVVFIPFGLLRAFFYKKRALSTFFFTAPLKKAHSKSIWIHAVSLGEVITAKPLIAELAISFRDHNIVVSSMTETGFQAAAKIPNIHSVYMPLDLWILQNHMIKKINPDLMIYVEGDVWPSLSHQLYNKKIPQVLLSAKLSEKSLKRLSKFPKITDFLFVGLTKIWTQDPLMEKRFLDLGISQDRLQVMGNLKWLKSEPDVLNKDQEENLERFLKLDSSKKTILVASTHTGEEELILKEIKSLIGHVNIILAPRHPQRFDEVKRLLNSMMLSTSCYSDLKSAHSEIFFLDEIGMIKHIYEKCDVCVLGGSFIKGIGGHNVLEPIFFGCPVIFGPYTHKQVDLCHKSIQTGWGFEVEISGLKNEIQKVLKMNFKPAELYNENMINKLIAALKKLQKPL